MPLPQVSADAKPRIVNEPMQHVMEERERIAKSLRKFTKRIGVHSGNGGVGKTFIACAIARLLLDDGNSVALIDADVDCPNVPASLGIKEHMTIDDAGLLQPVRAHGLEIASTGFLQEDGEPLIIRGPIKHRILTDFVEKVAWHPHDMLIIDFPPGTSDVPLSAMQFLDLTGVVLVTSPQRESLADVRRAAAMARKLNVPILGLIINMEGAVFGSVPESFGAELGVPIIARIPLAQWIREAAEANEPVLLDERLASAANSLREKLS